MKTKRIGALDFWKFIFCMVIVLHYACLFDPKNAESKSFLFYRGELAFDFFFIITGMMFAKSVNELPDDRADIWRDSWSYLKSRIAIYLPALTLCWIAAFAIINKALWIDATKAANNFLVSLLELLPIRGAGFQLSAPADRIVGYRIMDQAWVFSSVIIALAILYPLYRSNRERFEYYLAPVGAALMLGFLFFKTQILTGDKMMLLDAANKHLYFLTPGMYKAFGEILAGVSCYVVVRHFSGITLSKAKAHLLSLVEIGGYLIALSYMQFMLKFELPKRYDYLAAGFILVSAAISFSGMSSVSRLFNNKLCYFLGRFSLYPFITFILFAKTLPRFMPGAGIKRMTAVYLGLTLVSALVLMAAEKPFVKVLKASKRLIVKPSAAAKNETA